MGTYLVILLNIIPILAWLLLMLFALWNLRRRTMAETVKVIWVLIIVLIPIIGPLAFFIMMSNSKTK